MVIEVSLRGNPARELLPETGLHPRLQRLLYLRKEQRIYRPVLRRIDVSHPTDGGDLILRKQALDEAVAGAEHERFHGHELFHGSCELV